MKNLSNIKFLIFILILCTSGKAWASDISLDYIHSRAFENRLNQQRPAVREVSLFEQNKNKKKNNNVEVEHFNNINTDTINITDENFIKKYKTANKKKKRKTQFNINIQKNDNIEPENSLTEAQNKLVDDIDIKDDSSAKNAEPTKKGFFQKSKKEKIKSNENKKNEISQNTNSNLILTADNTDYYPERNEIVATGNVKLEITGETFELYGDKIIYNYDTNSVRAYDNVKIVQGENVTAGDFINVDINTAHAWIQKPVSSNYSIRIIAKEAYVYPDKLEEYDGVANIMEDKRFEIGSGGYSSLLKTLQSTIKTGDEYLKRPEPTAMKFKAKDINIDSKDGHNIITMKNIGVYYKKMRVGIIPQLKLITDKEQTVMQTNIPEIGSDSNMGMYIGPSFVLNTPLSSTLRIAPLLIYSNDSYKLGVGGAGTFMNSSNITDFSYGSAENKFMLSGLQKITPKLNLNYSQNTYTSQWFLGYRRPMYSAELEYGDNVYISDLGVNFEHKLSGGIYSDYARISKMAEGRLRWMTQLQKNLYSYTNRANTFSLDFGIIGQAAISQYTTGDTLGITRIAPSLVTTYRGWTQNVMYFQSGVSGKTPFLFDDYYYGKSNLLLLESLRLNKYISLGYMASMALGGRETYSAGRYNPMTGKFLQENMFLLSFGPDETKITLTYDAFRKTTAVYFSMLLGSKDMDIAFKKVTINNPDSLANENKKIPVIKNTFNKIRYKLFPLTDPYFDKTKDLYPQENNFTKEEQEKTDRMIEEQEEAELQNQLRNQLSPILQNQELMKDDRI